MNAVSFTRWVNDHLLPNSILEPGFPRHIGVETGRKWLHELGFEVFNKEKGVYIDAMSERMLSHTGRNSYVNLLLVASWPKMEHLMMRRRMRFQMISSLLQQSEDKKLYSFFMMKRLSMQMMTKICSGGHLTVNWLDQRSGIMVSDFITERDVFFVSNGGGISGSKEEQS